MKTLCDFMTFAAEAAADYHGSDYDANDAPDHHVEMVKWLQMKSVLEKEKFSGVVAL